MTLMRGKERAIADAMSRLTHVNPFLPDRIAIEKDVLGSRFVATREVWNVDTELGGLNANLAPIDVAVRQLLPTMRERLSQAEPASDEELALYEDLVLYALYAEYAPVWFEAMERDEDGRARKVPAYDRFAADVASYFELPGLGSTARRDPAFLFAYGYQTRRAFHHVFRQIFGASLPAAKLRASVWQSIFSHDRSRYRRVLYDRMHDFTTLITGESGTGKELVARAIGFSRFIPFDPDTRTFAEGFTRGFHPLNLSALSPTLIESELFGHKKGAFTGAVDDREGWLEVCGVGGTVFLDEVGELDPEIQVKLLRVLQSRTFQRLGETRERRFEGKIIAATNRDLGEEMQGGAFRQDFYYRLCSDRIHTPSLRDQLADHPGDLHNLVLVIARRLFGRDEADAVAGQVEGWIHAELGNVYTWPGNIRELEQCIRNVVIRGSYQVPTATGAVAAAGVRGELAAATAAGQLDMEELGVRYATLLYHQTGSYEEAARRLGLDRRTVKARVDAKLLERLSSEG
ncbi:MAG: sigma-54-dependent Fis family transcriptional regulator [Deltaproteobacteria bacterium]|nr:sigma-54-dependent Fis family transcriptional regulator [Deltaproteobacteria bacterium]